MEINKVAELSSINLLRLLFRGVFAIILSVVFAVSPQAGTNVWTSLGPEGGSVFTLVFDPRNSSVVYAGTAGGGVYKSYNYGANWNAASNGLGSPSVSALAIDRQNFEVVYAGTAAGVFKTADGGTQWFPASDGLPPTVGVTSLQIDPRDSSVLYAGTYSGLYKTVNGAKNWTATKLSLSTQIFAIDPKKPEVLYVSAGGQGLFKSIDGGENWFSINSGFLLTGYGIYPTNLLVDPQNTDLVYTAVSDIPYRSTDAGLSWSAIDKGFGSKLSNLALTADPQRSGTLYASTTTTTSDGARLTTIFRSDDSGATWNALGGIPRWVSRLLIDPINTNLFYVLAFPEGIQRSTDGARTWSVANTGLKSTDVGTVVVDPNRPTTLFTAVSGRGILKSVDSGVSWMAISSGLPTPYVATIAVDPQNPTTLYAGTSYNGIYKSEDGGKTWSASNGDIRASSVIVKSFGIDPQNTSTIYAVLDLMYGGRFVNDDWRIFKSVNGGKNWSPLALPASGSEIFALAIDPQNPTTVYVTTRYAGVVKSTDDGTNWAPQNTGLPFLTELRSIAIDPINTTTLYVGTSTGEVYKSVDAASHWTSTSAGLPGDSFRIIVLINPRNPQNLFAATLSDVVGGNAVILSKLGVYQSLDGGANWSPLNEGLINRAIRSLAIDGGRPPTLYAGTAGGGVFSITLAGRSRRRP